MLSAQQINEVPIDLSSLPDIGSDVISNQLVRWVFSAGEDINVADRHCGLNTIPRCRLSALRSFPYLGRNESLELLMDESADPVQMVSKLRVAKDSAEDIHRAYAPIGFVIVEALTGARNEFVRDLEQFIFDGETPETLVKLQQKLYEAKTRQLNVEVSANFQATLNSVIDAMIQSADAAMAHQFAEIDLAETEVERRGLPGGVGRPGYTSRDLRYFKQLERTPKTRVLEDLAEQQRLALKVVQQNATGHPQVVQVMQAQEPAFTDGRLPCPVCGEAIMPAAKKCRYCGEFLEEVPPNKPQKAKSAK